MYHGIKRIWGELHMSETKTFRESMKENNATFKRDLKAGKDNTQSKKVKIKERHDGKKAEYDSVKKEVQTVRPAGLNRTGNVLVTGFALWLAIPAIVVILIIGLFAGVGLWDWFTGLFS